MNQSSCLSVFQLVELIKGLLETNFVTVTVKGEVSNFVTPVSGHWYFTLKDHCSQLRAVMFRSQNRMLEAPPKNGMEVICSGSVSVYPARGEMQFIVEKLVPAGLGDLQRAFEELKNRLATEGLFDEERKRPIPPLPKCIAVVTSSTGAAIHDILNVLRRRAPGVRILLRPVKVQGDGAAAEIAEAILNINAFSEADVLIIGRGGGSLEDLWPFNEEIVARAIAASKIPIVSAVGHEVDFTISDFVSDLRAPTPSAAAELVAKNRLEIEAHLDHLIVRLQTQLKQSLKFAKQHLEQFEQRLGLATKNLVDLERDINERLWRLKVALQMELRVSEDYLKQLVGRLDVLSPLKQMSRGYVVVSRDRFGPSLGSVKVLKTGEQVWLRFNDGQALSLIQKVEES